MDSHASMDQFKKNCIDGYMDGSQNVYIIPAQLIIELIFQSFKNNHFLMTYEYYLKDFKYLSCIHLYDLNKKYIQF